MANRLQTDDTKGGQANWADIDDDDDDWAPETITWQDGTKIAIPHSDDHTSTPAPEPAPAPAPAPVLVPVPSPVAAPVPAAAPRLVIKENGSAEKTKAPASASSPIVKSGVLASGKGLVLKGAPEKPTLVAKPPAPPTPVKSPWATIPKVEKASPILTEMPSQGPPKPQPPRENPTWKSATPPPPKEIAADDFSRAPWRDGSSTTNRELYNSQSGRYEPAPDRRGSRTETSHGRQPALLQRGANQEQPMIEQQGTFRSGGSNEQGPPYGRRRGSSNVSGGSGGFMHRLKTHDQPLPPPEVLSARRESMTGRSDSPASPRTYSPSGMHGGQRHGQPWPSRVSPAMSHAVPYNNAPQPEAVRSAPIPPAQPLEDELELQKRVMRERRELAMKRRLEEEAREEAERKERIRLKLEAMGPAPESKSAKKAAAKEVVQPTHIHTREPSSQQVTPTAEHPPTESVTPVSLASHSTLANGASAQSIPSPDISELKAQPAGTTHGQVWPNPSKQPDRYTASWGSQLGAKNVWGAPNNNRSLGNGTFNAELGPAQVSQPLSKADPGPIAPPVNSRGQQAAVPSGTAPARLPPIGPPKQITGRLTAQERQAKQSAWTDSVRLQDDEFTKMLDSQYEARKETRTNTVIRDTWRPTKVDDSGRRDESAAKQKIQLSSDNSWVTSSGAQPSPTDPKPPAVVDSTPTALGANNPPPQPTRGSRFFPPANRERAEHHERQNSPSPPPPDMHGHPAFDGDVDHPHVLLPRPAPVVRLPPTSAGTRPAARSSAPRVPAAQPPVSAWASQPTLREQDVAAMSSSSHQANSTDWQTKFNNLLGVARAHPGPRSPTVDPPAHSYSREPAPHHSRLLWSSPDRETSVTTKIRDEECFEEQEMGSLPPVRLPMDVPEMAWQPSPPPKPLSKKLWAHVSSAEPITFPMDMSGSGNVWHVKFPGFSTSITTPFGRARSNPRRGGGQRERGGGRHPPTAGHGRSGKGRDTSSTYSSEQGAGASNASGGNRGSRGGFRGGRETWTRSAPIQT